MTTNHSLIRCAWAGKGGDDDPMVRYHDEEWGVPEHDDRRLFELLTLEGAQAGLSWETILKRREGYRRAFHGFDIERIAAYDDGDRARLLADTGIIRNRPKVNATIGNANAALAVIAEAGSLDAYLWRWVDGKPLQHSYEALGELPAFTELSTALSKDLVRRGFRFVGPTIMYAFMQASGMVNDHVRACFRYRELGGGLSDATVDEHLR
jgi:DNA-3-methyladenine glycosylase I